MTRHALLLAALVAMICARADSQPCPTPIDTPAGHWNYMVLRQWFTQGCFAPYYLSESFPGLPEPIIACCPEPAMTYVQGFAVELYFPSALPCNQNNATYRAWLQFYQQQIRECWANYCECMAASDHSPLGVKQCAIDLRDCLLSVSQAMENGYGILHDQMAPFCDCAMAQGGPCSPADVCGVGGYPALPDGLITGDDYVAFLSAFASGDLLADLCGTGGAPPPDGVVDGNDYVFFVNAFAEGCP